MPSLAIHRDIVISRGTFHARHSALRRFSAMLSPHQLEKILFERDLHRTLHCIIALADQPADLAYPLSISALYLDRMCACLWVINHDLTVRQNIAKLLGTDTPPTEEEQVDAAVREAYARCTDHGVVRRCIEVLALESLEKEANKLTAGMLAKLLFVTSPDMSLDEDSEANPNPRWRLLTARMMARRTVEARLTEEAGTQAC